MSLEAFEKVIGYEFKNKGIDLFINALGKLNKDQNLNNYIYTDIFHKMSIPFP